MKRRISFTGTANASKEMAAMHSLDTGAGVGNRHGVLRGSLLALLFALFACALPAPAAQAGIEEYGLENASSSVATEAAGAHSDFETKWSIAKDPGMGFLGSKEPWAKTRDIVTELPPGLLANPSAFPKCDAAVFLNQVALFDGIHTPEENAKTVPLCPSDAQVGYINPSIGGNINNPDYHTPVWNMAPPKGEHTDIVARLGFYGVVYPIFIDVTLDPDRDYALNATLVNIPSIATLEGSRNVFWSDPTSASHDNERFNWFQAITCGETLSCGSLPSGLDPTPYMSNPTSCGPAEVTTGVDSYQRPGDFDLTVTPLADFTDCESVPFEANMDLAPTTKSAGASSGLDVSLHIPQEGLTDPDGLVTSHLRKTVVTLPEGLSLNASAADGLGSCTESQIGIDRAEHQRIHLEGRGAPVSLSFEGQSTAFLPSFATASEVRAALEGLPAIDAGDVAVNGRVGGPWTVAFVGSDEGLDVPEIGGTRSEVQRIAVRGTEGTFTIELDGDAASPLPYNASPEEVREALEALPGIGAGEVEVSGEESEAEATREYRITFVGGLAGTDLPLFTSTDTLVISNPHLSETFVHIFAIQEGGSAVQTQTVRQGGSIGFTGAPVACPDSSKVATGEVFTPVLEDKLKATLYVAQQSDNPFDSLFAGYLVLRGPGVLIKVAGKIDVDPNTGQITTTIENPFQQPFEDLELHFKGGNRGLLTTPDSCGTYESSYEMFPWSGNPPLKGTSEFTLDGNCGNKPFAPGFHAGSATALAGSFATFNTQVTNETGAPALTGIDVDLPEGLSAKLAGIAQCSDAALGSLPTAIGTGASQLASPNCPANSQIGTVIAGAGSGSPFYVRTGKVYLSGPYNGAPLSLAVITPAVTGPFDLGNVLVRVPITLDRKTARAHAASDPIPTMLAGIPLDLRDVRVALDRQGFALNPTSCEPKAVNGLIHGTGGASAAVSDRFQVGECAALGFKPKLSLRLKGGTKRGDHPALTAIFRPRPEDANASRIQVALPKSEFLDQGHIGTVCTRVQFAADQCPKASIYGKATATTPLLDEPLRGNVYLRSSDHELPDLVLDLRGPASLPLKLEAVGRIDSVNGGIRSTFEFLPDAPVTRAVLKMKGGKKGLLQNSRDICANAFKASASFAAHNGRSAEDQPKMQARCKASARKGKRGKARAAR